MTLRMETVSRTLVLVDCAACAVQFAIPDRLDGHRRETGQTFWCPNGHTLSYKAEIDKLRKQLASAQAALTSANDQRDAAERSASALRGQVTKMRKRAAAGVCPCCHRTFQQLARHMANKHPGFGHETA